MMQVDPFTIAALLLSLGVGGLVGAVAAAVLSAGRLREAYAAFESKFRTYFAGRSDAESVALVSAFETLAAEIEAAASALERLKRAFKRR